MDKVITMDDTTHKNLIAERDAAQDKVKSLTAELAAERERTEKTKQWGESYQRALGSYFTKMDLDGSLDERIAAVDKICDEAHALRLIAELMGLSNYGPDVVRRRVKDIRTERNAAQARVKELEAELLKVRAAKCLDAMDASAGIKVEPTTDPAHAELAQIWELWGAGRPMTPGCVYEAAQEMERLSTKLYTKIGTIAEMLSYAGVPTHYGRAQDGGPVPLLERVGLLTESNALAEAMVKRWTDAAMSEAEQALKAHVQLDDLGAPRCAGSASMTIAHRIRALPGLLRQE